MKLISSLSLFFCVGLWALSRTAPTTFAPIAKSTFSKSVTGSLDLARKPELATVPAERDTLRIAVAEVPPVEDLERELSGLEDSAIEAMILKSQRTLEVGGLIQKANQEILSPAEARELVRHVRVRQACNKIMLERKLEEMNRKYL